MSERLALLDDLRRHAYLLRAYFEALAALAGSEDPAGIGAAAKELVEAMGQTSARIRAAKVGSQPIGAVTGTAATLVVGHFRNSALEHELETRAAVIERELALQEAAITAMTAQVGTGLEAVLNLRKSQEVIRPYGADAPLPADWPARRRWLLTASASLDTVQAAQQAAGALRQSFAALVENRLGPADIQLVLRDVGELVALIEAIRGLPTP